MSDQPTVPVVPKRPVRKSASAEPTAEPAEPLVPPRPVKRQADVVQTNESEPLTPTVPDQTPNSISQPTTTEPQAVLNSEADQSDSDSAEVDGDATPGNSNTKVSFKDDIDDGEPGAGSDSSSFNDDQETVQEDVSQEEVNEVETPTEQEQPQSERVEEDVVETRAEQSESVNEVVEAELVKEFVNELSNEVEEELSKDGPVKEDSEVLQNPQLEESTPTEVTRDDIEPKVPEPQVTDVTPPDDTPPSGSDVSPATAEESVDDVKPDSANTTPTAPILTKTEAGASTSGPVPIVPKRPKKPAKPSSAPATEASTIDKPVASSESKKAPPPKPKKLSSKIAAFQQMFNQQPPELELKDSSTRGKLSSDKVKFAQSLQGVMGRGIALPGMVNPAQLPPASESIAEADTSVKPISKVTRAKGPRGKRLPQALKTPAEVQVASRFEVFVEESWSVSLKKEKEEVKEKEVKEKEVKEEKQAKNDAVPEDKEAINEESVEISEAGERFGSAAELDCTVELGSVKESTKENVSIAETASSEVVAGLSISEVSIGEPVTASDVSTGDLGIESEVRTEDLATESELSSDDPVTASEDAPQAISQNIGLEVQDDNEEGASLNPTAHIQKEEDASSENSESYTILVETPSQSS